MSPRPLLLSLSLLLPSAQAATPPELVRAQEHLEALEYREALDALNEALAAPDRPRLLLLEILSLRGTVAAALGRRELADQSLRSLFLLSPDHPIPAQLSPRITEVFQDAQQWVRAGGGPLQFEPVEQALLGPGQIRVRVRHDALKLSRRVRFHFASGQGVQTVGGELVNDEATLPALAFEAGGWWAELLGNADAVLASAGGPHSPLPMPMPSAPAVAAQPVRGRGLRPLAVGLLASTGASLAAGALFGARSEGARAELAAARTDSQGRVVGLSQQRAFELDAALRRDARFANILFGATAALAGAGAAVWWWDGRIAAAPVPGGLAVSGELR